MRVLLKVLSFCESQTSRIVRKWAMDRCEVGRLNQHLLSSASFLFLTLFLHSEELLCPILSMSHHRVSIFILQHNSHKQKRQTISHPLWWPNRRRNNRVVAEITVRIPELGIDLTRIKGPECLIMDNPNVGTN